MSRQDERPGLVGEGSAAMLLPHNRQLVKVDMPVSPRKVSPSKQQQKVTTTTTTAKGRLRFKVGVGVGVGVGVPLNWAGQDEGGLVIWS